MEARLPDDWRKANGKYAHNNIGKKIACGKLAVFSAQRHTLAPSNKARANWRLFDMRKGHREA